MTRTCVVSERLISEAIPKVTAKKTVLSKVYVTPCAAHIQLAKAPSHPHCATMTLFHCHFQIKRQHIFPCLWIKFSMHTFPKNDYCIFNSVSQTETEIDTLETDQWFLPGNEISNNFKAYAYSSCQKHGKGGRYAWQSAGGRFWNQKENTSPLCLINPGLG